MSNKFRQEYGLGMGAGYYFKNKVGLFVEGSFGQFDYFDNNGRSGGFSVTTYAPSDNPEVFYLRDKPFKFRDGIAGLASNQYMLGVGIVAWKLAK